MVHEKQKLEDQIVVQLFLGLARHGICDTASALHLLYSHSLSRSNARIHASLPELTKYGIQLHCSATLCGHSSLV